MAYTVAGLTSKVRQRVRDTNYSSSEILDYLNDTQRDVFNEYRLRFMQTSQDYSLTISETDITNGSGLPSNFVQAVNLVLKTSGDEKLIPYKDFTSADEMFPDSTDTTVYPANKPQFWYLYGDTIRVHPAPDEAYDVTLRYYKSPTELTADDDVPEIPSEFEEILVSGATYRVLQVKDNYDQAMIHENKYNEILQKLVVKYSITQAGAPTRMRVNRRGLGSRYF